MIYYTTRSNSIPLIGNLILAKISKWIIQNLEMVKVSTTTANNKTILEGLTPVNWASMPFEVVFEIDSWGTWTNKKIFQNNFFQENNEK